MGIVIVSSLPLLLALVTGALQFVSVVPEPAPPPSALQPPGNGLLTMVPRPSEGRETVTVPLAFGTPLMSATSKKLNEMYCPAAPGSTRIRLNWLLDDAAFANIGI